MTTPPDTDTSRLPDGATWFDRSKPGWRIYRDHSHRSLPQRIKVEAKDLIKRILVGIGPVNK